MLNIWEMRSKEQHLKAPHLHPHLRPHLYHHLRLHLLHQTQETKRFGRNQSFNLDVSGISRINASDKRKRTENLIKQVIATFETNKDWNNLILTLEKLNWDVWRRSLEMACQRRTSFRCKRNKGIYYQKFRCNQEGGGGRNGNDTRVASTARCNRGELS